MQKLEKDTVLTIIGIGDFMGSTFRRQVKATGQEQGGRPIFKETKKGSRKMFMMRNLNNKDTLIFKGDIPFAIDGDVSTQTANGFISTIIRGNACLNLVGDANIVKDYIENHNLNENFSAFDHVLLIDGEKEIPLYPDTPTAHAVIERIRGASN